MRNLPYHDLPLDGGMNTTFEGESVYSRYASDVQNMDWYDEFKAVSKVPGSSLVADFTVTGAVTSLHYFEFVDLDYIRKRRYLAVSDGNIYSVNTATQTGTLIQATGDVGDEQLREVSMNNRLHLTAPKIAGATTGGYKYDGSRITNWGVVAPGQREVVVLSIDDKADWNDGLRATSATDAVVSIDNVASLKVAKDGTGGSICDVYRDDLAEDMTDSPDGFYYIYVFLGSGMIQLLNQSGTPATAGALEIWLGTGGSGAADIWRFTIGELTPGWNLLAIDINNRDDSSGAGLTKTNCTYISLRAVSAIATTLWADDKLRWDKFFYYGPNADTPTLSLVASGQITATVTYRISYVTEYGFESNLGPVSASESPSGQKVQLTNIPTSPDTSVIARRIYRDLDADYIFRFVDQIDDNSTTSYLDNIAESSLGGATGPIAGDTLIDHTPPPRFSSVTTSSNRVWGVDASNQSVIWVSDVNDPEAFRLVDQFAMDDAIVKLESHNAGVFAYSTDKTYIITGDGVTTPVRADLIGPQLGANGEGSVAKAKSLHIVAREAELYEVVNPADPWLFNTEVLADFNAMTPTDLANAFIVHDRRRFRILFFRKGNRTVWVYQYGTAGKAQVASDGSVDPLDLRLGSWHKIYLPNSISPQCAVVAERDADLPELWIGGGDGNLYYMQDPDRIAWKTAGADTAVTGYWQSHSLPLGVGPQGRGEPRYIELQAYSVSGADLLVSVELREGNNSPAVKTKAMTVTLPAGSSSIVQALPAFERQAQWARVKIQNIAVDEDARIRVARLYYVPRSLFGGAQS